MLAEHFLTMYPNLNVDIDSELEQLKVRTGCQVEPGHTETMCMETNNVYGNNNLIDIK